MTDYKDKNEVSLWKNDKRTEDWHAHYTGSATVDGVEYWAKAYPKKKEYSERAPLLKIILEPKKATAKPAPPADADFDIEDDMPF